LKSYGILKNLSDEKSKHPCEYFDGQLKVAHGNLPGQGASVGGDLRACDGRDGLLSESPPQVATNGQLGWRGCSVVWIPPKAKMTKKLRLLESAVRRLEKAPK
jgi:hypothetical protein